MFLAAAYNTVSDIEILWMVVAATGLIVSLWNLRDARLDRNFLVENDIWNGRRIVANVTILSEIARSMIHALFLTIGILAAFLPEIPPQADIPTVQLLIGIVIRWGLITASLLLMGKSLLMRWMRKRLQREDHSDTAAQMEKDVGELTRFATEADERRLAGKHKEQDVVREK